MKADRADQIIENTFDYLEKVLNEDNDKDIRDHERDKSRQDEHASDRKISDEFRRDNELEEQKS